MSNSLEFIFIQENLDQIKVLSILATASDYVLIDYSSKCLNGTMSFTKWDIISYEQGCVIKLSMYNYLLVSLCPTGR